MQKGERAAPNGLQKTLVLTSRNLCMVRRNGQTVGVRASGYTQVCRAGPVTQTSLMAASAPAVQPEQTSASNVSTQSSERLCDSCELFADDNQLAATRITNGSVLVSGYVWLSWRLSSKALL